MDGLCFVIALAVLFYDRKLFEDKKRINVKNCLILVAEVAGMYVALLAFGGLTCLITENDIVLNYLPKLIVMALYVAFFNKYKWQSRVILAALIYALNHCLIEIGGCLSGVIDASIRNDVTVYIRSGMMVCSIGAAVLLRFFNIDKCRKVSVSAVVESGAFSCIGLVLSMLRSAFIPYFSHFEQTEYYQYSLYAHLYIMIILICITFFIFACYMFLVRNIKANEANMELNGKLLRLGNIEETVAVNENNLRQLYKIKHEIKNRFSIMQDMLEHKKYDELEEYFKQINGDAVVSFARVSTGNDSFDRVFNLEISKAVAKNIEVATKLVVPPGLPISDIDLGGLITNLMDNAIEACEKVINAPKLIDVTVRQVHGYLILKITNTLSEESATMPSYGESNGNKLIMLRRKAYDDEDWDKLLDQMSWEDQAKLVTSAAYGTTGITSVTLPEIKAEDGPTGVVSSKDSVSFPSEGIWASTFNKELIKKVGDAIAEDARNVGVTGMYQPGVNIHRTPFGGRAHEYFSEDPYLSAVAVEKEGKGLQAKGIIPYVKHFAFNDEEDNRIGVGIWLNEQSAREIYLKPFEYAVAPDHGKAHGVMSSFNRTGCIWTSASAELMENILRGEFGFDGAVLTDMALGQNAYMTYDAFIYGTDLFLDPNGSGSALNSYASSITMRNKVREAVHRYLYTVANYSAAMNGYSPDTKNVRVLNWWQSLLIAFVVIFFILSIAALIMTVLAYLKANGICFKDGDCQGDGEDINDGSHINK